MRIVVFAFMDNYPVNGMNRYPAGGMNDRKGGVFESIEEAKAFIHKSRENIEFDTYQIVNLDDLENIEEL